MNDYDVRPKQVFTATEAISYVYVGGNCLTKSR